MTDWCLSNVAVYSHADVMWIKSVLNSFKGFLLSLLSFKSLPRNVSIFISFHMQGNMQLVNLTFSS